jgi:hypothetical protein
MSESLEAITKLVNGLPENDQRALKLYLQQRLPHPLEREWAVDSDRILTAIDRSSDLTKRGIRGIIAEAVFVNEIAPSAAASGWRPTELRGDHPYDALLKKGDRSARIQVKLQRLEGGTPKQYYPAYYPQQTLFVVEVQKTRTGEKTARNKVPGTGATITTTESVKIKTRPYHFGDFDILAVSMHPSTGSWKSFRYTVASWLLPREDDEKLIQVFQPVAGTPNEVWTDNLMTCLQWYEMGEKRIVLSELLHVKRSNAKT